MAARGLLDGADIISQEDNLPALPKGGCSRKGKAQDELDLIYSTAICRRDGKSIWAARRRVLDIGENDM